MMVRRLLAAIVLALTLTTLVPAQEAADGPVSFRGLRNASMFDLIDQIARQLEINYMRR